MHHRRSVIILCVVLLAVLVWIFADVIVDHRKSEKQKAPDPVSEDNRPEEKKHKSLVHENGRDIAFKKKEGSFKDGDVRQSNIPPALSEFEVGPEADNESLIEVESERNSLNSLERYSNIDTFTLVSLIQGKEIKEEIRSIILNVLLDRIMKETDSNLALQILTDVKDFFEGEELHFILKSLHRFADIGGNEAIVDTFFQNVYHIPDLESARILSYLDPKWPLDKENVDRIAGAYLEGPDRDLRTALLGTLSNTSGDFGVYWIIDFINAEEGREEQMLLIDSLGRSKSEIAFDYLHELINNKPDTEMLEYLRQTILNMKNEFPEGLNES